MGQVLTLMKHSERTEDYGRIPILPTPTPETLNDAADLFMHLTSWTVPHGWELVHYGKMLNELGFTMDAHHNWHMQIGDAPTTCFMAHLDTACREARPIIRQVKDDVCSTDDHTILGADDRAGVALLLHLVSKDVPGLYYLFVGEECGRIGSGKVAEEKLLPDYITKAISFDRKGYHDIITHQCGARGCSEEFAEALAAQLNDNLFQYEASDDGVYTDSLEFFPIVAECTNISVGYECAHSTKETQDLRFLRYLADCLVHIDWEALPVVRTPAEEFDWRSYDNDDHCYIKNEDGSWSSKPYSSYTRGDYRNYGEYDRLGKELDYYSKPDPEGDAYDALNELVDNFELNLQADPDLIEKLILKKKGDTVHMIEALLEELRSLCHRRLDD